MTLPSADLTGPDFTTASSTAANAHAASAPCFCTLCRRVSVQAALGRDVH